MDIGIPKETFLGENRLTLSPLAVQSLTHFGHNVYIQAGAGSISFYDDSSYVRAGATLVYSAEEVYGRTQLISKVERPDSNELELLQEAQIIMSFLQPAASTPEHFRQLMDKKICAIGLELIQKDGENLPIVRALSEIAGQMTISIASRYLESVGGGRGILICGAPGVPPAEIVIIGAGNVGSSAASAASRSGASVTLLDTNVNQLRKVRRRCVGTIVTATSTPGHIEKALSYADVLITAIRMPNGGKVHPIVSRAMVRKMKKGSVIIDASIDQGGAVETSRPTTLASPTYIKHGVVHYCVPNMSSAVPRTASRVLADAVLPFILEIANEGLGSCLLNHNSLSRAVFTYEGKCCNRHVAELFSLIYVPLAEMLAAKGGE